MITIAKVGDLAIKNGFAGQQYVVYVSSKDFDTVFADFRASSPRVVYHDSLVIGRRELSWAVSDRQVVLVTDPQRSGPLDFLQYFY